MTIFTYVFKENGKFVLVGISSFVSASGCFNTRPNVYARAPYYLSWIKSTVGNSVQFC